FFRPGEQVVKYLPDLQANALTVIAFEDGILDLFSRLPGRLRAALGQCPNLAGDDGEAHPGFARPGCLDGGVEREDIGLKSDLIHQLDDFRDAAVRSPDTLHGQFHVANVSPTRLGDATGLTGEIP